MTEGATPAHQPSPLLARGPAIRLLPRVDGTNRFFWTSGQRGQLQFLRCASCQRLHHPPAPLCPYCLHRTVAPSTVSGRAILHAFTVNYQPWIPGSDPYAIGLVCIDEQPDIRLTTNIVDVSCQDLQVGMALRVVFEAADDVWLPLFAPADVAR